LDKSERRVELKIRLKVSWEEKLDLHRIGTSIVQNDFLSVELIVHEHIQVVLFLLNIDGHIDACPLHNNRNRLSVILILEEESELLRDLCQLVWHERELDLGAGVPFNRSGPFERHLR